MSRHSDSFYYVLSEFQPALKSIDVRTIGVCFSPEMDWENLITSIIISDKTVEEIKAEHQLLPHVRNNCITIFYEALPFNFDIFEALSKGEIKFLTIYGNNKVKTRMIDSPVLKIESRIEWNKKSKYVSLKASDQGDLKERKRLWDTVYVQKNLSTQYGFSNFRELVKVCLNLQQYDFNVAKDLEITIFPSVKIEDVLITGKKVKIKIENPHEIKNIQLNFNLHNHSGENWIKPQNIDSVTNYFETKIEDMLPLDTLNVKLVHNKTGLRLDEIDKKVPLENVSEPLLKTLDAFCSIEDFKKMLFEPKKYGRKPDRIFENAITWLLSLAGFETLALTTQSKKFDELHLDTGYHVGSADIIAYEENERLFLIDCDINSVEAKKVEKLCELAKHLKVNLDSYEKLPIVPILFTPIDFTKTSPSYEVLIADKAIIRRIFEAIVKGQKDEAKQELRYSGV